MRAVFALALVVAAGCDSQRACRDNTVFVDLAGAAGADQIHVEVTVGARTYSGTQPYAGQAGIEIDFPTGYPGGTSALVTVTALHGVTVLARGNSKATLGSGCTHLSLSLDPVDGGSLGGDGGNDLAAGTVTVVGTSFKSPVMSNSISLPLPNGTQAGDFLVLTVYANSATATVQMPQGWTMLTGIIGPQGFQAWWLTRSADAALTAPTVGFDSSPLTSAALVAYRGTDPVKPVDTNNTPDSINGQSSTTQIVFGAPSISPARSGTRLLAVFVWDSGDGQSWIQSPAGTTKIVDTGSIGVFDGPITGTATGPTTATASFNTGDEVYGTALVAAIAP
jgi:hypothetical protein